MKAKALKKGDTIGVIAPAGHSSPENVEKALKILESMGYKAKAGKTLYQRRGYLAGNDTIRAEDFNQMFADNEVDAIICLRGGYGTPRILDKIDYNLISNNPKIFMGYSDITALHIAIHQRTGLITFHGPMLSSDLINGIDDFTAKYMRKALLETKPIGEIKNPEGFKVEAKGKGQAWGRLIGGNLSLIASTIGTPFEINTKGSILFLEDIGEEPYRIDRMLMQLRLSGKLNDAEGLILCDWNGCKPIEGDKSLSIEEVFEDILYDYEKPVLFGYKIGHCSPQITVPIGVSCTIDADKKSFHILESGVK